VLGNFKHVILFPEFMSGVSRKKMNQEELILQKSKELFFRLGVKSVTMDDLAREMGISKKTLYLYVENKSDLVEKVMRQHVADEIKAMEELLKNSANAIEQIIGIIKNVLSKMRNLHPSTIYDVQKYYPKTWKILDEFKHDFIFQSVLHNLQQGVHEGLYREDLNTHLIAKLYVNSIDYIVNPAFFPATQYNFSEIYFEYIKYHIRGVVSEKGREYLKTIELQNNHE
jgi:TetR/AcrR family transcriptional regulator, cholesterol catabolism regulator